MDAIAPQADALAMTNCISARVRDSADGLMFEGQQRGIGGEAIREASIEQVEVFGKLVRERQLRTKIIGGGGISAAGHVKAYLDAGAEAVQLATAIMIDPMVGCSILSEMSPGGHVR